MNDFSLMFTNIPTNDYFMGNEAILRIKIHEKMKELMTEIAESRGEQYDDSLNKFQIIDINFANTDMSVTEDAMKMNQLRK